MNDCKLLYTIKMLYKLCLIAVALGDEGEKYREVPDGNWRGPGDLPYSK